MTPADTSPSPTATAYEWDCPSCGERISTFTRPPAIDGPTRESALSKIARAEQAVDDLCSGKLRWEMRVPAEPDHDPDLIISDALRAARLLIEGQQS